MRLMMVKTPEGDALGVVEGDGVAILPGRTLREVCGGGEAALKAVAAAAAAAPKVPRASVKAAQPVLNPGKFICIGLNFTDHAKEGGNPIPDYPALFLRVPSSLIADGEPMVCPKASPTFDYEAELTIVIGKGGRHIPEDKALEAVFGYTIFNDGSVRAYQRKSTQWTAGKNFDATGPIGPEVVTCDELPDGAHGLAVRSILNGKVMQDGNTSDFIFSVAKVVSTLSEIMTLEPGDMIATGTPAGVGYPRKPPVFMKAGDEIVIEIEGIGRLTNPIVDEA
ncbi:fumarylacetoacetate hydrolase family protein [Aquabacter spiritensis]|uniref:2-keto-4-pentenoate hydratase/2-oxohepta-3-ene-1,7-dioic acid hydratase in catechol pathway n=1 Tax=Aquabacter spiritensis TaxID=933073 RepID=A0A4R3LK73_9HYPH|nr:fumarylacetoacetate hydrolase family protein [Aquabacter spiritensis]TCT00584.1 2-keto-4-pentenoate hydratase/2-oxohepta-3-ene-1,7-dioic acid hydratase in catechol pathway [Aquabacter spiritensis]